MRQLPKFFEQREKNLMRQLYKFFEQPARHWLLPLGNWQTRRNKFILQQVQDNPEPVEGLMRYYNIYLKILNLDL